MNDHCYQRLARGVSVLRRQLESQDGNKALSALFVFLAPLPLQTASDGQYHENLQE